MTRKKALSPLLSIAIVILIFFSSFGILLEVLKEWQDPFDFSPSNGGRCVEWKEVIKKESIRENCVFQNASIIGDNNVLFGRDGFFMCFHDVETETICAFVTNNHNVTVPYELAKERGFKL